MAGDLLGISLTGLTASQRVLSTISNNIANVNTDGYSRQSVDLATRNPQFFGNGYLGKGVIVNNVRRNVDAFVDSQLRSNNTSQGFMQQLEDLSAQVDNIFANEQTGLSPVLQDFFNGLQEVADDPASITARQVLLSESQSLVSRYHDMQSRVSDLNTVTNDRITDFVDEINSLAKSIADVNLEISLSPGVRNGIQPNDLLDQRGALLNRLSGLIGTSVLPQDDGSVNVLIGNGQTLVVGPTSQTLSTVVDPRDSSRLNVAYSFAGNQVDISANLNNGKLGGVLDFRGRVLEPARNELGRLAATLAMSFNQQHYQGMDLNGNLNQALNAGNGLDYFTISGPQLTPDPGNAGAGVISVSFDAGNVPNLSAADYQLRYNGSDFVLTNLADNSSQTLAGGVPPLQYQVDGLVIDVAALPNAGDTFLIQPTRQVARDIQLNITDPRAIAAALPVRSTAATTNASDAGISTPTVLDATDANLLISANIVFANASQFSINGGPLQGYTSGANIDANGWRVQITGTPKAGDTFTVQSNAGGAGDNGNALLLGALQTTDILDGGSTTFQGAYGRLVADVGAQTRQAEIGLTAATTLREQAVAARETVSGVNLDEEAANLLRFQQSYQASAQAISVAGTIFDTLLAAVGR